MSHGWHRPHLDPLPPAFRIWIFPYLDKAGFPYLDKQEIVWKMLFLTYGVAVLGFLKGATIGAAVTCMTVRQIERRRDAHSSRP